MEKRKLNNGGFSLIELIVVIAIMAILVGALAPQFLKYIERTNVSTDMQNVSQLKTAVEVYVADMASQGNSISDDITITIAGVGSPITNFTATVGGGNITSGGQLGLSDVAITLKSKNWPDSGKVYTYSHTNNTWSTSSGDYSNDGKNMNSIF